MTAQNTATPEVHSTGARGNANYIRGLHLLSPVALRRWAEGMSVGKEHHGAYNWLVGIPAEALWDHLVTHLTQFLAGDKSEDHLGHAFCRLAMLIHFSETQPRMFAAMPPGCEAAMLEFLQEQDEPDHNDALPSFHDACTNEVYKAEADAGIVFTSQPSPKEDEAIDEFTGSKIDPSGHDVPETTEEKLQRVSEIYERRIRSLKKEIEEIVKLPISISLQLANILREVTPIPQEGWETWSQCLSHLSSLTTQHKYLQGHVSQLQDAKRENELKCRKIDSLATELRNEKRWREADRQAIERLHSEIATLNSEKNAYYMANEQLIKERDERREEHTTDMGVDCTAIDALIAHHAPLYDAPAVNPEPVVIMDGKEVSFANQAVKDAFVAEIKGSTDPFDLAVSECVEFVPTSHAISSIQETHPLSADIRAAVKARQGEASPAVKAILTFEDCLSYCRQSFDRCQSKPQEFESWCHDFLPLLITLLELFHDEIGTIREAVLVDPNCAGDIDLDNWISVNQKFVQFRTVVVKHIPAARRNTL